jgi:2',3'-cyclic-nucleotide 2'-phosphodiesterase (5'-nucleotidase family)
MPPEDQKPGETRQPETPTPITRKPLPKYQRLLSPGSALLVVALTFGVLVTFFLWRRGTTSRNRDDFKPEVVIIQMNDTYRVDALENGTVGGPGRVATLIQQIQAEGKQVIVVHAGDFIAPSLESKVFKGIQMIDALNYLKGLAPVYVVPGNHEFDDSDPSMAVNAIEHSNFDWIGSNVTINPGTSPMRKTVFPNRIVHAGKLTLGMFALTLHGDHGGGDQPYAPIGFEDKYLINDTSLQGMGDELPEDLLKKVTALRGQRFESKTDLLSALAQATGIQDAESLASLAEYASIGYVGIAERQIQELERAGVDIIIALTHLNMPDDKQLAQLRRTHPKFMWIVGGHEHYAQRVPLSTDTALITKAYSNARSVWRVAVGFENGAPKIEEEEIELKDPEYKPDEVYQRRVADYYRKALIQKFPYLAEVVGNTSSLNARCLEGDEDTIRTAPSNWGSYIADQMRVTNGQGAMQIGLINGGGIRIDDRPCGELSFEHLERTFAFDMQVVYIKLAGEDLKQRILENAVAGKRGDGRFLQFAGITFSFDRRRAPANRVYEIKVRDGSKWVAFDPKQTYTLAVPEFLYKCNNGYTFREKVTFLLPPGPDVRSLVYRALKGTTASLAEKQGAVELPGYANSSMPRLGPWVKAPANNPCPTK